MRRLRLARPSPSLAISLLALFVALGGVGYAAATIGSAQIKNNSIRSVDIRNGTIVAKDINATTRASLKGQKGDRGDKGDKGDTGSAGAAGTSIFDGAIPTGKTVAGAWGGRYIAPQLAFNNTYLISVSFPVKAPAPLSDLQVNVAPNAAAGDPDPTCAGSANNPTAPPGKVCLYISRTNNARVTGFRLTDPGAAGTSPGDAYGFIVRIIDAGTVGNTATTNAEGTWAYTAP
jgi:hypothetical protein